MSSYTVKKTPGDTSWFVNDRFGMFIHFGLYAMPARHEWVKYREKTSEEHYNLYFKHFNPDLFDAKEWAKSAKDAGMKYVVITAKHHEGFCLFDSKYTDYKITNTPFGRDLIKEYTDACREEGIKVGFYYSLVDWNHPHYTIDRYHPRREDADAQAQNQGRDMKIYAEYMRNQITELLSDYGKIDILWFDFSFADSTEEDLPWMKGKGKDDWESEKLIETVRKLQPGIIINNRTEIEQDLSTPEQYQMLEWPRHKETGELLLWEACQTFSGSWGYNRDECSWKTPKLLIDMLVNTVSLGGNLLMNVGPTSRGYFDKRAIESLNTYKEWMKYNSRSIYGCTMAEPEFVAPRGTRLTQSFDGKRLYIHLVEYPYNFLEMRNLAGKIEYVQLLHDGSEILYTEGCVDGFSECQQSECDDLVAFTIPQLVPDVIDPVIEIILK